MIKTKYLVSAAIVAVLSTPAHADNAIGHCKKSSLAHWMSADAAVRKAREMQLDVQGIYTTGSYYEVRAVDPRGTTILVYVDPVSGKVVHKRTSANKRVIAKGTPACTTIVTPAKRISVDHIYEKAAAMNMDVRGIELVGAYYQVHAVDAAGQHVLAYFDATSATNVSIRRQPSRIGYKRKPSNTPAAF